ncbi:PLP-dependent transferase [bacterium]|nr:MAG: PLP-dependent transferase [bacterium]
MTAVDLNERQSAFSQLSSPLRREIRKHELAVRIIVKDIWARQHKTRDTQGYPKRQKRCPRHNRAVSLLPPDAGLGTRLAHLGEENIPNGAVVPPIFQNSLFTFDTVAELMDAMIRQPNGPAHHYSRISNPTLEVAERKIADLEGAEACKVLGCGMAAIANAILSVVQSGSHVIIPDTAYYPARVFVERYLARFGVTHTYVSGMSTEEIFDAIRPETALIYLEAPTSALFRMQDIPAITKVAREKGISTIIDNTYATPLFMQPLALGVDIVCHSATKYMGGHSDVTAGAICTSNERMDRIVREEIVLMGNILHPFPAWLLTRGLRTLELRLKRHEATGNAVAGWLETRPEIERVHHISLASYPQRDLYQSLMKGSGGLFSFEPKEQSKEKVWAFCDALNLFQRGISWGGHESLVVPLLAHPADYVEAHWVIRLYTGLEEPEDLIRDIESALPALR